MTDDGERVTPFMRTLLAAAAVLVLVAGVQLYVLTGHTDTWFAWTVAERLTAASVGAFYLGALAVVALSALRRRWVMARIGLPAAIVMLLLTAGTMFSELGTLHLGADRVLPALAAWLYVVLGIAVPILLVVAYVHQRQESWTQARPARTAPLPWLYVGVSFVLGIAVAAYGIALFIAPGTYDDYLPWQPTTIGARAIAAWIVALGILLVTVSVAADVLRARPAFAGMIIVGALQLVALARYPGLLHGWPIAAFIAVFGAVLGLGLVGLALVRTAPYGTASR